MVAVPLRALATMAMALAMVLQTGAVVPVASAVPLSVVSTLTARQSGEGQVSLSWTHSVGRPTEQRIKVYDTSGGNRLIRTVVLTSSATSTTVNGLTAGRRYLLQLQTSPKGKANAYVKLVSKPFAVKGLRASWFGDDLLVTWNPVASGVLVGVVVSGEGGYRKDFAVSGSSAGVRVTGADPAGSYRITAVASNAAGTSPVVRVTSKPAVPAAPVVSATPTGPSSVSLSWSGSSASGWRVQVISPGSLRDRELIPVGGESTAVVVDGLSPGADYIFKVNGINDLGTGPQGTSNTVRPPLPVSAPVGVVAIAGDGSVSLTWAAGTGVAPASWRVSWRAGTTGDWSNAVVTNSRSHVVTGLENGVLHQFRVEAVDAIGVAIAALPVSATPVAPAGGTETGPQPSPSTPATPTSSLDVVVGDGTLSVAWQGTAAQLLWQIKGASIWTSVPVTGSSHTLSGLTNGALYRIRVVDSTGTDVAVPSEATPVGPPQAVRNLTAAARHSEIGLTWNLPANTGGVAMTGYLVRWRGDAGLGEIYLGPDSVSYSVTGLVNGISYTVTVIAFNELGESLPASIAATPAP
jgi:hypothetical protein